MVMSRRDARPSSPFAHKGVPAQLVQQEPTAESYMSQASPTPDGPPPAPEHPPALQPGYPVGGLDCPILVFEGELELEQGPHRYRGPGVMHFAWFPTPRVTFRFHEPAAGFVFNVADEAVLHLGDGRVVPRVHITHAHMAFKEGRLTQAPSGRVASPVSAPAASPFTYLLFLLPNFPSVSGEPVVYRNSLLWAARVGLVAGGWRVTLDAIEHPRGVLEELRSQSGNLVTHVGRLEREDGSRFTEDQAITILDGLGWYLSFACGRWTGPLLACGHDAQGATVRELWTVPRVVPWRFTPSWLDDRYLNHLTESFPGYMQRWTDPDWSEVVELATHWYVEANAQAGSVEGALVLSQAAFEMLAWAVVGQNAGVSAGAFDGLPAADHIRRLFVWADVPLAIPASQPDLAALAGAQNWTDAPQALAAIRNSLTHPTPRNRARFRNYPPAARSQAWNLALWYLEMCLLRLIGYNSTYGSRLAWRYGCRRPLP